ncbi:hypothetical protein [Rickettsia endosymbiont of Gonocerus acuteangulatus]|uniref:hypothetical protein n=1 Tax=Rickettsia endosymbiont of Gonocerus acuteangulatus TaxID=3066266 RepID=UPI0031331477
MPKGDIPPPPPPVGDNTATLIPQKAKETNQPRPAVDTTDLMKQIQGGFNLKKIEYGEDGKPIPKNKEDTKETSDPMIAALNKIRSAKVSSDSERSNSDSGTDSG